MSLPDARPTAEGRIHLVGGGSAVRFVTIPSRDVLFARLVERVAGTLGSPSPRRLALHLRALFPSLAIHRRELAAEALETWYVFRDGQVTPSMPQSWWEGPGLPRARIDWSGAVHEASASAWQLFEVGADEHVTIESIAPAGTAPELHELLALARTVPVLDTVLSLRTRGGTRQLVALHGERQEDGVLLTLAPTAAPATGPRVVPICLPAWDDHFIGRVEHFAAQLTSANPEAAARQLETRLRPRYPSAVVRHEPAIVDFGIDASVLLAYRDGNQSPYADDRWWERPDTARIVAVGSLIEDANEEACQLLGRPREDLLGLDAGDLHAERAKDDERWLNDVILRTGQLHATTWMVRGDGEDAWVEVHARQQGDGVVIAYLRGVEASS